MALLPKYSFAQLYLEPFAGFQKDLNNQKSNFVNSGLQFAYKLNNYEFLFQMQKNWPFALHSDDQSFTADLSLPLYEPVEKTLNSSLYTLALGNRFKVAGRNTKNSFFIKLYTGIAYQKTLVKYKNTKAGYVILNPDQTQEITGPFISGGLEYMRQAGSGRLFFELNFSTPPAGTKYNSPTSFNPLAPVSLNIGYDIKISKK